MNERKLEYNVEVEVHERKIKTHSCDECGNTFSGSSQVIERQRHTSGENFQAYKCTHCGTVSVKKVQTKMIVPTKAGGEE